MEIIWKPKYGTMDRALIRPSFPDNILIDIEAGGKTPTVCDNSTVENGFASCNGYVDANLWNASSYIPSSSLGEFISYCQSVGNNSFWDSTTTASRSTSASSPIPTPTPTTPRSTDPQLRVIVPTVVVPGYYSHFYHCHFVRKTTPSRSTTGTTRRWLDNIWYKKGWAASWGEEQARIECMGNEPVRKLEDTSPQELPVPVIISELSAHAEQYPVEHWLAIRFPGFNSIGYVEDVCKISRYLVHEKIREVCD